MHDIYSFYRHKLPTMCSVHGINFRLIFSGEICLTEQTGGTALTEETLQSAVTLASKQAQEIQQALKALR